MKRISMLVLVPSILLACGDNRAPLIDDAVDAPTDAPPDAPSVIEECGTPLTNQTFTLSSSLAIYGRAAFDGKTVWVTYTGRELDAQGNSNGKLDTFAVRLGCDGQLIGGTQRLSTTITANDTQPFVAVSDDSLMYGWSSELNADLPASNCTAGSCLRAFVRSYNKNDAASPILFADKILRMRYNDVALNANVIPTNVSRAFGNNFYVTGVRAIPDATSFQLFLQEVDRQGAGVGDAVSPLVETGVLHSTATSGISGDTIYIAFEREEAQEAAPSIALVRLDEDKLPLDATPAILGAGRTPLFSTRVEANAPLFLAYGTVGPLGHAVIADPLDTGNTLLLGAIGNNNSRPTVVSRTGGGAVAWMESTGGTHRVRAMAFAYNGSSFTAGTSFELSAAAAGPYGTSMTHVTGDIYFVSWSESVGGNDFRLRGRYVTLAQPN